MLLSGNYMSISNIFIWWKFIKDKNVVPADFFTRITGTTTSTNNIWLKENYPDNRGT